MSATRYWTECSLPMGSFSALLLGPLFWASEWGWCSGSMSNISLRLELPVSPYHCCVSRLFVRRFNRGLFGSLGVIEKEEDGERDGGVDGCAKKLVQPKNVEAGEAEKTAVDEVEEKAVEKEEAEVNEDTGS